MQLGVNYANLVRGETFLDALDLREAHALAAGRSARTAGREDRDLAAERAALSPAAADLSRARRGGDFRHPGFGLRAADQSAGLSAPKARRSSRPAMLAARIIEEIKALRFEAAPPVISLTFTGDLAEPDKIVGRSRGLGRAHPRGRTTSSRASISRPSYRDGVRRSEATHRHRCRRLAARAAATIGPRRARRS